MRVEFFYDILDFCRKSTLNQQGRAVLQEIQIHNFLPDPRIPAENRKEVSVIYRKFACSSEEKVEKPCIRYYNILFSIQFLTKGDVKKSV